MAFIPSSGLGHRLHLLRLGHDGGRGQQRLGQLPQLGQRNALEVEHRRALFVAHPHSDLGPLGEAAEHLVLHLSCVHQVLSRQGLAGGGPALALDGLAHLVHAALGEGLGGDHALGVRHLDEGRAGLLVAHLDVRRLFVDEQQVEAGDAEAAGDVLGEAVGHGPIRGERGLRQVLHVLAEVVACILEAGGLGQLVLHDIEVELTQAVMIDALLGHELEQRDAHLIERHALGNSAVDFIRLPLEHVQLLPGTPLASPRRLTSVGGR